MAAYFIENRNIRLEEIFWTETKTKPVQWDDEYNCEEYKEEYTQWLEKYTNWLEIGKRKEEI